MQYTIKSFKHEVNTVKINKKSLTKDEDVKRCPIIKNNNFEISNKFNGDIYETLALGHYLTCDI